MFNCLGSQRCSNLSNSPKRGVLVALLLIVSIISLGAASVVAESTAFECKAKDILAVQEALQMLEKVQSSYSAISNLTGDFLQYSYLASLETSETSSGKVWFVKPGKMRWHYVEPDAQDFLVRGDTVWLYQEVDNQIIVDDFRKILLSDAPVGFLMGLGNLRREFEIDSACRNDDGLLFALIPRKKGKDGEDLKGFKLLVDTKTFMPRGASVTDIGDNITSIILSNLKGNSTISDDTFEPKFPKNADIIDRRKANG